MIRRAAKIEKKYKFMQNERPDFIKLFSGKKEQDPRR